MKIGKSKMLVAACGLTLALAGGAQADTVIFSENFDGESTRARITSSVGGFDVSRGSVDVFGPGFNDFLPGNGNYLDMHGHRNTSAGKLTIDGELEAGTYELSFDLAGAQRESNDDSMTVTFGDVSETYSLAWNESFSTYTMLLNLVSTTNVSLMFDHAGTDGRGMLLDNVMITMIGGDNSQGDGPPKVSVAPTPAAAMAGLTLMGFLAARRRRKA